MTIICKFKGVFPFPVCKVYFRFVTSNYCESIIQTGNQKKVKIGPRLAFLSLWRALSKVQRPCPRTKMQTLLISPFVCGLVLSHQPGFKSKTWVTFWWKVRETIDVLESCCISALEQGLFDTCHLVATPTIIIWVLHTSKSECHKIVNVVYEVLSLSFFHELPSPLDNLKTLVKR